MKGTIISVVATIVACVVGIIYTEWRNTDPHIAGTWITVSPDFITLTLLMMGSFAGFVLVCIGVVRLWPIARWRFRSKKQRFAGLAPELASLQGMTLNGLGERVLPSLTDRTRAHVLLAKLNALGINCKPPTGLSFWTKQTWQMVEMCFAVLAVLASESDLERARTIAENLRDEMAHT